MFDRNKIRRIEVQLNGQWVAAHMEQLEKGDTVRMFEPDGTPVEFRTSGEFSAVVLTTPSFEV